MTAPSRPIATTPSGGTLKSRVPGGSSPGAGDGLGEAVASSEEAAPAEPEGRALGSVRVVPNGVGETAGETDVPGMGVAVAGTAVGLGVGVTRGVGRGVGGGVGCGVGGGVGAVTTTVGPVRVGLVPRLLVAEKVTVQVPAGSVDDPLQVPRRGVPLVRAREMVRVVEPFAATARTLLAVSLSASLPE